MRASLTLVLATTLLGISGCGAQAPEPEARALAPRPTGVPALPPLAGAAPAVAEAIRTAHQAAVSTPGAEQLLELATVAHANAQYDLARAAYARVLELNGSETDVDVVYALAVMELRLGNNEAAIPLLRRVMDTRPWFANAPARLGQILLRLGRAEEAEAALRAALDIDRSHPHAAVALARLLSGRGEHDAALEVLRAPLEVHDVYGPAHRMVAIVYGRLGRDEDRQRHEARGSSVGIEMPDPVIERTMLRSSDASVLVTEGKIALTWGDRERAERFYRRALAVAPDDVDVLVPVGRFLAQSNVPARRGEAIRLLEHAITVAPDYLHAWHDLAIARQQAGDEAGAIAAWEHVTDVDPQYAMAWMSLGQCAMRAGDALRARRLFERGLAVRPDTAYALGEPALGWWALGAACAAVDDAGAALDAYRQAREEAPDLRGPWVDAAALLRRLGRADEGLALLREAVATNAASGELRLDLAQSLIQDGRFGDAEAPLVEAAALRPDDPRVFAALGYVRVEQGRADEALESLERATQLAPNLALVHYHLGNAYRALGREQDAQRSYRRALQANPRYAPAREALER